MLRWQERLIGQTAWRWQDRMVSKAEGEAFLAASQRGGETYSRLFMKFRQSGSTCPVCTQTSYNPHDREHGWCARCCSFTFSPEMRAPELQSIG